MPCANKGEERTPDVATTIMMTKQEEAMRGVAAIGIAVKEDLDTCNDGIGESIIFFSPKRSESDLERCFQIHGHSGQYNKWN